MRATFVGLLLAAASIPVLAQQSGDPDRGRVYATRVCVGCHALEATPAPSPNALAPSFFAIANTPGVTDLALGAFLFTPHRQMPDLVVAPGDARDLIAYILNLKRIPPV